MPVASRLLAPLAPHHHLPSVLDLSPDWLQSLAIDGLLLDVDCTLKDHGQAEVPPAVIDWLDRLRGERMPLALVSNGKGRRIGPLASALDLPFVAMAGKPLPFGLWTAARRLGLKPSRSAIVGDQLFTDVLAGRLAGLRTILVSPTSPDAPWMTRVKRPIERWVLRRVPGPRGPGNPLTTE